jgi:hypothetical protein
MVRNSQAARRLQPSGERKYRSFRNYWANGQSTPRQRQSAQTVATCSHQLISSGSKLQMPV